MSPVKTVAIEAGIPVHQPEKVRAPEFVQLVTDINPDVIVVASFGQLIPKSILDIPGLGNVNVHSSLLPKFRGAAPIHYAIFEGEARTGVTTMLMGTGLDTGPILLQRELEILPDDTEGTLEERLAEMGAPLLMETLDKVEKNLISPIPQDDAKATYAPSVKKEDCLVRWENDAVRVVNRIRGCNPRPGAYTFWRNSPLKIWSCRLMLQNAHNAKPGEVLEISEEGIVVAAGSGSVLLVEVQPENKKRMKAGEFARGYGITKNVLFGTY
jgi:methionyl-tRNA formyltransferase